MTLAEDRDHENEPVKPNDGNLTNLPDADSYAAAPIQVSSLLTDVTNVMRGFCMGAADTVPGVSGGTIALILGHYEHLVSSISRIDREFIRLAAGRRFRQAWRHIDGRFLTGIGTGIVLGIAILAGLMHWLLDNRLPETFAAFSGLILASVLIVRKHVQHWSMSCYVACAAGIVAAVTIGRLSPSSGADSLVYLFLSASIAICAMILPGISGAFVMLLFGVYHPITGMIKETVKGHVDAASLIKMCVFAFGCLFGLLAFSRLLRWLLDHRQSVTMSALMGLMVGSVDKLWPLQVPTDDTAHLKMKERVMERLSPADWEGSVVLLIAIAFASAAAVLILERVGSQTSLSGREHGD